MFVNMMTDFQYGITAVCTQIDVFFGGANKLNL